MNNRLLQIGISQRISLEWLERTANLVLSGNDEVSIYRALQDLLIDKLSVGGNAKRGNREKVISILMKVWVRSPKDLYPLQHAGLQLLSNLPGEYHMAVHWGMTMAVYPFWGVVAAHVGRLLKLQGTAVASQVQRRLREHYGERETVSRAVRRVLRSFVDWGVLKETSGQGIYSLGVSRDIHNAELVAWLAEALLFAHPNNAMAVNTIFDSTCLFPFRLRPIPADHLIALSGRLNMFRHGLDQDLIMLRRSISEEGAGIMGFSDRN